MNKRLLLVLFANYGTMISIGLFTPVFALYIVQLGGSAKDAGIAMAFYYVLAGALMLLLRTVIDKSKQRPGYFILGTALESITAFLLIFVGSLTQFYIVQLVHAVATALRLPAHRTLYAQYADKGKEGSEWSLMEGGNFMIVGIAGAIGGLIVAFMSFHTIFVLMGCIQLLATLFSLRLLKPKAIPSQIPVLAEVYERTTDKQ